MKKALLLALTAVFVVAFTASAFAAFPTVIDTDGGSRWSYQDASDSTAKREGGYLIFNDGSKYASSGASYTIGGSIFDQALYFATKGPHGGYDTTTNKCKACHAVHRAEGTYYLLRADSQDDACNYCHIGASAKSNEVVYTGTGDPSVNIYTRNGHTIGAGSRIPDSSIDMTATTVTIGGTSIKVRNYHETKKQLFRTMTFGRSPASHPTIGDMAVLQFSKVGPTPLSCSNCHQVHNASSQIWKPPQHGATRGSITGVKLSNGYKLLRRFPGSTSGTSGAPILATTGLLGSSVMAKVPESTLVANTNYSTVGSREATYTEEGVEWRQPDWVVGSQFGARHSTVGEAALVSEYAMSVWCADCHNLNIGAEAVTAGNTELGLQRSHADRTHPVPGSRVIQCYSCHRSGLTHASTGCDRCHYGPVEYRTNSALASDFLGRPTDFPHAGNINDEYKLLGAFSLSVIPYINPDNGNETLAGGTISFKETTITADNLDAVCLRCHTDQGVHQ